MSESHLTTSTLQPPTGTITVCVSTYYFVHKKYIKKRTCKWIPVDAIGKIERFSVWRLNQYST